MGALAVHHTATDDGSWDGPANEARLRTDGTESYYRSAYAWQDPDGDPETKSAYRFIHHAVNADGDVGPANLTAASTGIGVLNGGRGGTTIPDSDRRGVWSHLAAHLRDADLEPPDLRDLDNRELRAFHIEELRVIEDENQAPKIEGYAAVFNLPSEDLGGFREVVRPGAFKKTLAEADVRALLNHDPNYVLGRIKSGTLTLKEDIHGLRMMLQPPETQYARDLMAIMKRGDVDQMSFGFQVVREDWLRQRNDETDEEQIVRTLVEVKLFDVSIVTFPAYPQTTAQVRSKVSQLQQVKPTTPAQAGHLDGSVDAEQQARGRLEVMRRRLDIAGQE